jgi:hypothetical protein
MDRIRPAATPTGLLLVIVGLWSVWLELGRDPVRYGNAVVGGPNAQAVFGSLILAVVGAIAVVWGVTRKR